VQGGAGRKRPVDRRIGRVWTPTAGGPVSHAELTEGGTATHQRIGRGRRCRVGRRGRLGRRGRVGRRGGVGRRGWVGRICRRRIALLRPAPGRRGEADRQPDTARAQSPRLGWHARPEKGVAPYGPPDSHRRDRVAQDPEALPACARNLCDEPRAADALRGDVAKVEHQAVPAHAHRLEPPSGIRHRGCCCDRHDEQARDRHKEPGRVRQRGPPRRGFPTRIGRRPELLDSRPAALDVWHPAGADLQRSLPAHCLVVERPVKGSSADRLVPVNEWDPFHLDRETPTSEHRPHGLGEDRQVEDSRAVLQVIEIV
jgi:hypothetical protein